MRRFGAVVAALVLGVVALPAAAGAQGYGYGRGYDGYSDGYDRYRNERYDRDYGGYDRRERWREERGYGRPAFGNICVTARGSCRTRPGPLNAPCGCDIPGFGYKRGGIGAY